MTELEPSTDYRVLARKYRPVAFSGLIGQDVLVRTLTNAFQSGRLAHAFVLTGVRGVGKTTTARIIARALNCIGPDGTGEPTTEPCGECANCMAIAEDRHVDVLEMDAASRTGVDDIRELIEGVRYRPTSARYKVYIIDEVHMLSKNAFNALLKTLEEPPAHVKFIFATTEIRKVPVTVLSRCQRFDLNRVPLQTLSDHFKRITEKEGASITDSALHLISRAADGSVRDGLSLLDQSISQAEGEIGEVEIRNMLGLVDRSRTFELIEALLAGETAGAFEIFEQQYRDGGDPSVIIEDMLEIVHWMTRLKVTPSAAKNADVPEMERVRGLEMSGKLSMAALARAWQILLKGLGEVRIAPSSRQAADMILVRLAYASTLPTPEEALKSLGKIEGGAKASPGKKTQENQNQEKPAPETAPLVSNTNAELKTPPEPQSETNKADSYSDPATFEEVLALVERERDGLLQSALIHDLRLIKFETGYIEFIPGKNASPTLAGELNKFLDANTSLKWKIAIAYTGEGSATIAEQRISEKNALKAEAEAHPLVKTIFEAFPGASIEDVRHPLVPEAEIIEPTETTET